MDPKLRITDLDHSFVCLPSRVLNKNERYLNYPAIVRNRNDAVWPEDTGVRQAGTGGWGCGVGVQAQTLLAALGQDCHRRADAF